MIPPEAIDDGARRVVGVLQAAGYTAYLAGGCVRDLLLGRRPKDWDVATDAGPDTVRGLFERSVEVGVQFGVVRVRLDGRDYEVARFRREGPYSDGRRPDRVEFSTAEEDAHRRDFTINGMFYDLATDRVLDFVGGRRDLEARVLRAVGDPRARFVEDGLRTLRAVRLAVRLGFAIDPETWRAVRECAPGIDVVSGERVRDELTRILVEGGAARGLELLRQAGLLERLLPEVAAMKGVEQSPDHHPEGDVWTHVVSMLAAVDALHEPSPTLAWGVLLHDVGKPVTRTVGDRIRFHGHDRRGAEMVDAIARRLRLSKRDRERIRDLTAQHMRFRNVRGMRASKLKRFLRQESFPELLELHRIDCESSHGKLDLYAFCLRALAAADREGEAAALRPPRLLTGHDLIDLGLVPGPAFGRILRWVEDEQLEGRLADREAALAAVRERWAGGQSSPARRTSTTGSGEAGDIK